MKIKNLISIFSADTHYKIVQHNNPHLVYWWGQGNNCSITYKENEILGIRWDKKGIIIYI